MSGLDLSFPWIGLPAALVLLALLLGTRVLQADPSASRWRDLTWLSWAGAAVYLLHNVEEYGVDLEGRTYAFPVAACGLFGFPDLARCPAPPAFFTAVNVSAFWFAAPIAAALSRRHPLVGLAVYGVMAVNIGAHVVGGIVSGSVYNPGWFTALAVFLPLTIWVARTQFGPGRLPHAALVYLLGSGAVLHVVLAATLIALMEGIRLGLGVVVLIQALNAALLVLLALFAERWRGGALVTSRPRVGGGAAVRTDPSR